MSERQFRLFLSSPSDVQPERDRAKVVIDRLNGEFQGLARIDILRWEDAFYTAAQPFQEAIDNAVQRMSGTDLVVCIVWSRVGLKLDPAKWRRPDNSPYESGTVLEFETACEASRKQKGAPDVYLFRKTADVLYRADRFEEEKEQHTLLEAVWKRWTQTDEGYNTAGYQRFRDTDEFEQQFESCIRQWLAHRGLAIGGPVWERDRKGSPFCGLAAFDASHAAVFFGRDAAIEKAIAKLRRAPFLLLIGASGSGKSSLLRAGLLPRVTRPGIIPDVDVWRSAIVLPTADPLMNLAEALCTDSAIGSELREVNFGTPATLYRLLVAGWETAEAPIRGALDRIAQRRAAELRYDAPRPARLLIAVDQVERLFVEADAGKTEAFARILRALVEQKLAYVIAVLRSDAYGRFQRTESFVALREAGGTHDLLPPTNHELEDIVSRPAAACRPTLAFEVNAAGLSLAEVLVTDARGGDALPLLQMTLQRLYQAEEDRLEAYKQATPQPRDDAKAPGGLLRFADYPGMGVAVTRTAEEAFATLSNAAKAALPALITALVRDVELASEGEQAAVTVVPVVREAFERGRSERTDLVQAYIANRLLTTEETDGVVRVRPVHEALLRAWPEAVRIIKENAALIRVRHTLEPMVAEWSSATDDIAKRGHLVTSSALLAGAEQLTNRFGDDLAAPMRAFVADSLKADAQRRDAEKNRQRKILAATASGLVVAVALGTFAAWQWRAAQLAEKIALDQRNLAVAVNVQVNELVAFLSRSLRDRGLPINVISEILNRATALQDRLFASGSPTPELLFSSAQAFNELVLALLQGAQGKQANIPLAIDFARRFEQFMATLVAQNPRNSEWQYQLSLSYNRLGDVFAVAGRYQDALDEFSKSLAIREKLLAPDAGNARWQEAVATVHTKIGDMLVPLNKFAAAIAAYDKGLAIRLRLVEGDRNDADRQRELAVSYERKGRALLWLSQFEEALEFLTKSIEIRQRLATDPNNVLWRRDLSVSYEGVGDALTGTGKLESALTAYQECFAIRQALAAEDSFNRERQRDLAVTYGRIGNTQLKLGQRVEGLDALHKSLDIRERLTRDDPDNVLWQTDLVIALRALALAGDDARARLTRALEIARRLRDEGKLGAQQMGWVEALEQELAALPN